MLSKIHTGSLHGVDGLTVVVETDLLSGLPNLNLVGLAGPEIREAKERVRSAVVNSGYSFPAKRITINLVPANTRKEGSHFDLPMAIGMLTSMGEIPKSAVENIAFIGELSLDGKVNSVQGVLPLVMGLCKDGARAIVLPESNIREASLVKNVKLYPVESLLDTVSLLKEPGNRAAYIKEEKKVKQEEFYEDYSDVAGQEGAKRAITVGVAGRHGLAMIGFPGTGKSMLAKRIPTIMPEMSYEEKLEVTKIYSVAGELSMEKPLVTARPFRSPHHTISPAGLIGGGSKPRPGEFSLAHCGVLFLDEFPEFERKCVELLRQPMEDGKITICRAGGSYCFPGEVMMVAAANPCKCGYNGDETHRCTCTLGQIAGYRGKFSGPILDRIDIHIEIPAVKYAQLAGEGGFGKNSAQMKAEVLAAGEQQRERYKGSNICWNSQLDARRMKKYCELDKDGVDLMKQAFEKLGLSARAYSKVLKVSRTIADIEQKDKLGVEHLAEALRYRSFEKFYGRD